MENTQIKIGIAQIAPVWLNKEESTKKVISFIEEAAKESCSLVTFGETLLPGYPFWISLTNGAEFNSKIQKKIFAHYLKNSINIERGDLKDVCETAKQLKTAVYLGIAERAENRGGHSIYCSLIYINKLGEIKSVHRKLQPTFEERLCWSPGDGNGLRVHKLEGFTVGGLNCWENWMPLSRTALYAQGENLHVAVWPGSAQITNDITRFVAKESRSFVISASGLMRKEDFPAETPHLDLILEKAPEMLANGGSCIAGPDGEWIIPPQIGEEQLITAELDLNSVYEERQNFDPSGHYSRPDITQLHVNRGRQALVKFND
ncbi:carbon-nitrogen hydrolase family protein [Lentimicrobium sp. S6]|uniref:carbon-nitrogen hydrolase family protein n=1 Tax=Lentimicrobium sp. S6 TaxID=2735872 RepID=UPI0015529B98|nr:carbon-nitrogen hydrolase family protein [Lentimicrobium sp. S6]NPD45319.1 carbon-nitrogen hydrolase family protein [Lentimicrobium sp. S6]